MVTVTNTLLHTGNASETVKEHFMPKNTILALTFILTMVSTLILAGCDNGITTGNQNTPPTGTNPGATSGANPPPDTSTTPGTAPASTPDPKTLSPALRAVPTAASTASPFVLDSYTDGTKNYYLIDVGYVRNMFVSKIMEAAYNGMTPISVSKTTISTSTVTEALTETISESITVSDTQSGKTGISIEAAWVKKFPIVGKFSAKLNVYGEWTGSWTNSKTSSKSSETSVSKTESLAESLTTSVIIGEHGEPAGNYRYALYATSDVYFIISTSMDNQSLLSWDTVVCARNSSYTPHWDYSADGIFDNSPDGKEITFAEDFYRNLAKPTGTEPINSSIKTELKTIRTETVIISGAQLEQPMDIVNFDVFGINLNKLIQDGYKTVSFYIQLNVREIDDGHQYLYLYSSPIKSTNYRLSTLSFEHSLGKKDTNWWVHYEKELKFENISLDKFQNNEFVIRYSTQGTFLNPFEGYWENKDLKIQLVIKK